VLIPTELLKVAALMSPEAQEEDGDNPTKGRLISDFTLMRSEHVAPTITYESGCECDRYYPLVDIYGNERCMACDRTRAAA
jgi:hypothetical protein